MTLIRILAVAAASWLSIAAATAQTFTLKISSPTVNDLSQEWAKAFKAGVEARSNGRIKVEFYPANQLGQIPATVEGTAMGTIEAVVPASGFFIGLEPRFQVFDAPGLFNDMAHAQRVLADPGVRKQLASLGSGKGIEPLAMLAHGPLMLLSHKPIRAVADFKGQKIRVPGAAPLQIEPFKKLGAAPVSMPLGEVLSAMQNRTIDGLIASAPVFTAFKYYDLAKGLTALPGSFLIAVVMGNKNFLKSLGPELEAIVREEAFKAQQGSEKFAIEDIGKTFDIWKKNGGEVIMLPEAEGKAYTEQVKSVLPGILNANPAIKADFDVLSAAAQRLN
jgi:TRAP-type transport system periplasmic protein